MRDMARVVLLNRRNINGYRNRTAGDIRHIFDKFGGNLGTNGCVAFMFDKRGRLLSKEQKMLTRIN